MYIDSTGADPTGDDSPGADPTGDDDSSGADSSNVPAYPKSWHQLRKNSADISAKSTAFCISARGCIEIILKRSYH